MSRLPDGAIAPSHLKMNTAGARASYALSAVNEDDSLHVGYVVGIHYPGEKGYEGATGVLYDVICPVVKAQRSTAWQVYSNIRWGASVGGSIRDYTRMRLNVAKGWSSGNTLTEEQRNQASRVIIQCENGRSQSGIIIGFAEHPASTADSAELGHHYLFTYNGIDTSINKDGEWSVTFTGAILDGNTNTYIEAPEATKGTTIKLDMKGGLLLDNTKGESIYLDKENSKLNIQARKMATNITEENWELSTEKKVDIQAKGNAVFNSGKKVFIGKEGSTEPLVLGNKLAEALGQLVDTFLNAPLLGQAGPFPCILHPSLRPLLMTWKMRHKPRIAPFLSKKGFVE